MIRPSPLLILSVLTTSVNCFFYQALPLAVVVNNNTYRAHCPWNDTLDGNVACKLSKNVMGYYHKDKTPEPHQFLNPLVQKLFTRDHCSHLKESYKASGSSASICKSYSLCFNLSDEHSMCTCDAGFFGDPYEGCKKHCFSNDECVSPVSFCNKADSGGLAFCQCKPGYLGDGVMCYRNPCEAGAHEKCGEGKICVPNGPGDNDYRCICPEGKYLDYNNNCVPEVTLHAGTVLTLTGKNVQDGSRIEAGECISFILNDGNKSIFFHKNSGDSVYVRRQIRNVNTFTLFFVLTDEVSAFSAVSGTQIGLTKLYSMTNTFKECRFGNVRITRPNGQEVVIGEGSAEKVEAHVRNLTAEELQGSVGYALKFHEKVLEGEQSQPEVRNITHTEL